MIEVQGLGGDSQQRGEVDDGLEQRYASFGEPSGDALRVHDEYAP